MADGDAEGRVLADGIRLIRTPGHTAEDISTLIEGEDGLVVCTHAWWFEGGPDEDPYAPDAGGAAAARATAIRGLAPRRWSSPGHGPAFAPSVAPLTPRRVRRRGPSDHPQTGRSCALNEP